MREIIIRTWLAGAFASFLLVGCETTQGRQTYPDDPLLISKKPIESKVVAAKPVRSAETDPVPPEVPALALAVGPMEISPTSSQNYAQASEIPSRFPEDSVSLRKPVAAIPAVRTKVRGEVPAIVAKREKTEGPFRHADDYRWVQGVLDKHYQGNFNLRYCDHSVEDRNGGKVILLDDPRLKEFKEGDVVFIEGELVTDKNQARNIWNPYPRYRVSDIRLIQRKF